MGSMLASFNMNSIISTDMFYIFLFIASFALGVLVRTIFDKIRDAMSKDHFPWE